MIAVNNFGRPVVLQIGKKRKKKKKLNRLKISLVKIRQLGIILIPNDF